jgi:uroporphyrinogen-III decarboxylase
MSRQLFLDLAAAGHRWPLAGDLILHRHADAESLVLDGARLGGVVAEAAAEFRTPLAVLLMDLRVEKAALARAFGAGAGEADTFHFAAAPAAGERRAFLAALADADPTPRIAANLGAVREVARRPGLLPVGMSIGPFSLLTKLLADPITPVFLAGEGATADDDPEVALLEAALELSTGFVLDYVSRQLRAGARAVFIAEPAANQVYLSPKQLAAGANILERFVLEPNRRVAELLARHGADHLFHCCGELVDPILDGFVSLRPALLSLGSSRQLAADAARVPKDIVLFGNLPSKRFYSDELTPESEVPVLAETLVAAMRGAGHPFILGTECDTLHVPGTGETILRKVRLMLGQPVPR